MDDRRRRCRRLLALGWLASQLGCACLAAEEDGRHVTLRVGDRLTREDNLYRLPDWLDPGLALGDGARGADVVNSASLAVAGRWSQGEQDVAFDADVAANRFADNEHLDNESGRAALEWAWRFGGRWSGRVGAEREQALASFANTAALERDVLDTRAYVGDVRLGLGPRWGARLRGRSAETSHDNELRRRDDSEQRSAAFGVDYESPRASTLAWELRETRAAFPAQAALGGAVNDYDERASSVQLGYALTQTVRLDAGAGHVRRTYALAEDGNFDGGVWSVALAWLPTPSARLTVERFRDVRAQLEVETNHFVSTGESLTAAWSPIAKLMLTLELSREEQRYIGAAALAAAARRDTPTLARFALTYAPRERVSLEVAVRDERRESSNARFDYSAGAVSIGAEARF